MTTQNNFNQWLKVFVEEKEINTGRVFEFVSENGTWNYMPLEVVLEFIKGTSKQTKAQIKENLVKIDFYNGDVYHFFEFMAKGISQS